MASVRTFKKDIEILSGKKKDDFMELYRDNLAPCTAPDYKSPTFLNKASSQYAYDHPECCEILLVSKNIFKRSEIMDIMNVLGNSLESQKSDNENSDYRKQKGLISDLIGSLFIGHFNYNPTPFSCIEGVKYQSDTGHLNYRLEFKLTSLSAPTNHIVEAYDTFKGSDKREYKFAITDECLLLSEELSAFKGVEKFCSNAEDYIAVLNLGVMTKESYNHHLKSNHFTPFSGNDYKAYLSKEVYNELIPIRTYNTDYIWKMTSPLHFVNCIGNLSFMRLLCGCLGHLFQGIENDPMYNNIISPETLKSLPNLYEITRNRLKGSSNFYYSVGKGDSFDTRSTITLRLLTSYNDKLNNDSKKSYIYFTDVTITKENVPEADKKSVKVKPTVTFSTPIIKEIPNFSICDDDTIEDFIRDNFSTYPVIGYGIRGLFALALKKLNRDCISGQNVERTVYYLDLDDILTAFSMNENEKLNKKCRKNTNTPFYFDNSCVDMINVFSDSLLKGSPIRTTRSELRSELQNLQNNIYRYLGENKLDNRHIISLLPLLYIFYISVSLLTSKGLVSEVLKRISFYYPTILKSPNGDFDYNELINYYCTTGLMQDIEEGAKAEKNKYKDYMYFPSDLMDDISDIKFEDDNDLGDISDISKSNNSSSVFDSNLFGLSVEDFECGLTVEIPNDLSISFEEVLETAKDSFNDAVDDSFGEPVGDTLSQSTLDFCDKIAAQGSEMSVPGVGSSLSFNPFDRTGGPVDLKEMKSSSILEEPDMKKVTEAELSTHADPIGTPSVDFSMDDEIGFGASSNIPNLLEEMKKWDTSAEEIEDICDVEDTVGIDEIDENSFISNEDVGQSLDTDYFIQSLLSKENGFTDKQIRLFVKSGIVSKQNIKDFIIDKLNKTDDMTILLAILNTF